MTLEDFKEFVSSVNPRFVWYEHCKKLARVLLRVANGELKRLMIFMPPRHSKSETVSRLFSAFYLKHNPSHFVGLNCYAAELANTLSRASRENFIRDGGKISDDSSAVKHWETKDAGGMWAAGVGGAITGKGFNLGIIDDPVKNAKDAASEVVQASQQEWYSSTFYTRAEPDAAIVYIGTRWHENDLAGWLLSQEGSEDDEPEHWHIVNFTAIKEDEENSFPSTCSVEKYEREADTALCPERYSIEKLRKIEKRVGPYYFAALYQQKPRPREGNLFKLHYFKEVSAIPVKVIGRVRYWDLSGSDSKKADFTVGGLMSRRNPGIYTIEDIKRGKWTPKERNAHIKQTAENDRLKYGHVKIIIEQPPGLAIEVVDEIVRQLAGYSVYVDKVNRDKETRADPFAAQCEAGNVEMLVAEWNKAYTDEMLAFPNGKNDDQVDVSSGAFNTLAAMPAGLGVGMIHGATKGWGVQK